MLVPQLCPIDGSANKLDLKKFNKVVYQFLEFAKLADVNYRRVTLEKWRKLQPSASVKQTIIDFEEFSRERVSDPSESPPNIDERAYFA